MGVIYFCTMLSCPIICFLVLYGHHDESNDVDW